jgi:hypothetical protein
MYRFKSFLISFILYLIFSMVSKIYSQKRWFQCVKLLMLLDFSFFLCMGIQVLKLKSVCLLFSHFIEFDQKYSCTESQVADPNSSFADTYKKCHNCIAR